MCRGCARLQLPCGYDLRLKWHTNAADKTISSKDAAKYASWHLRKPLHFVHFSARDFERTSITGDISVDADLEASRTWKSGGSPSSAMLVTGSISALPSPPSSYLIVDEPSCFPPLELSSPFDEMLFMYCKYT